jgi:hypothetical protein
MINERERRTRLSKELERMREKYDKSAHQFLDVATGSYIAALEWVRANLEIKGE